MDFSYRCIQCDGSGFIYAFLKNTLYSFVFRCNKCVKGTTCNKRYPFWGSDLEFKYKYYKNRDEFMDHMRTVSAFKGNFE